MKIMKLSFEVPNSFELGDCEDCPISFCDEQLNVNCAFHRTPSTCPLAQVPPIIVSERDFYNEDW